MMKETLKSNTFQRIISAIVLIAIVCCLFFLGVQYLVYFLIFIGLLTQDEILINMLNFKRGSVIYYFSQTFAFSLLLLMFFEKFTVLGNFVNVLVIGVSFLTSVVFLYYLFFCSSDSDRSFSFKRIGKIFPFIVVFIVAFPLGSGIYLLSQILWKELLLVLLVVNFSTDSGAWFFGRMFGKRKLWPVISPKKTIEGLVGGLVVTIVVTSCVWYYLFQKINIVLILLFFAFGLFSQLGDLIQSKFKRSVGIKDSSSLIPGHGGVYDRIDSLIFLLPIFSVFVYIAQEFFQNYFF